MYNVDLLLPYLNDLPDNKHLSLKVLSKKLATSILLAIAAPKRFMKLTPEYVVFRLSGVSKIQRDCTAIEVTYYRFSDELVFTYLFGCHKRF